MNQNRLNDAANGSSSFNRPLTPPATLCHSCGSVIQDVIPPPPPAPAPPRSNSTFPISLSSSRLARRRTEEPIPERYTCVAIYITGVESVFLTFCHKCNENFEGLNGGRQVAETIVDESGDHERLLACLECIPLNYSIGDGPDNCAPYVVNIRYTEQHF